MSLKKFTIGNAAGWVKLYDKSFDKLRASAITDFTVGSYTVDKRDGNNEPTYWSSSQLGPIASINSKGLPNQGIYPEAIQVMQDRLFGNMQFRVSIAGFKVDEFEYMAEMVAVNAPRATIELNLGCPNVIVDGSHKPIFSFEPELIDEIITKCTRSKKAKNLALKVSPYSDPGLLREVAEIINRHHMSVGEVVTCNTFPNALSFKDGKRTISGKGYGGLAGYPLKHIMLGQVAQFREHLTGSINVIGVGGISTGQDLKDALDAGASGIQIGTAYFETDDPGIFGQIAGEYYNLVL
jgi:dihydroorotate dehydrogenase (fumarate)